MPVQLSELDSNETTRAPRRRRLTSSSDDSSVYSDNSSSYNSSSASSSMGYSNSDMAVQQAALEADAKLDLERFKNRRRMAWLSMFSIIIVTGCMMFIITETKIKALETVITWFYMTMGTVVTAYMGFASWYQIQKNNNLRGK